jgi:hypothetical protein
VRHPLEAAARRNGDRAAAEAAARAVARMQLPTSIARRLSSIATGGAGARYGSLCACTLAQQSSRHELVLACARTIVRLARHSRELDLRSNRTFLVMSPSCLHDADAASPLTKASEWTMSHAGWVAVIALAFLVGRVTNLLHPGLGGGATRSARAAATGTDKVM